MASHTCSHAIVRPVTEPDLATVTSIYADHVLHGVATFEIDPPDRDEIGRRVASVLERGLPWLVAESEGEVVGYAYASPFRARPAYDWLVEDSIYLRSDRCGAGLGSLLLAELVERCTTLGYRQMLAVIGDSANDASIRLHRRFDFAHVGVMPSVGWKHGRWLDVVMMQRVLGAGASTGADVSSPDRR